MAHGWQPKHPFARLRGLWWLVGVALALGGSACGGSDDPETATAGTEETAVIKEEDVIGEASSTAPPAPGEVVERSCGPGVECAQEFLLNGVVYAVSCRAVQVNAVSSETIGSGSAFGIEVEVRPVEGFEPDVIAAVSIPGGYCSETDPDEVHTPWSLAFANDANSVTVGVATCEIGALSPSQAEVEGCEDSAEPESTTGDSVDYRNVAAGFIDRLATARSSATGYEDAAEMWSGYPYREDDKLSRLQEFVDQNAWLADNRVALDVLDAYSHPEFEAMKIVTVTDADYRGTTTILIDGAGTIQRIQLQRELVGSPVVNETEVVIPYTPIEGSLVAYLDTVPIPSDQIEVNRASDSTVIRLPDSSSSATDESRLLIVSMATPEFPTAFSLLVNPGGAEDSEPDGSEP